jgi:hypothetical protein
VSQVAPGSSAASSVPVFPDDERERFGRVLWLGPARDLARALVLGGGAIGIHPSPHSAATHVRSHTAQMTGMGVAQAGNTSDLITLEGDRLTVQSCRMAATASRM